MHLEKVEIQGFKSFAPKTTVLFDRGITAVVGPNGSGKSNVADAIRWVMGEQSMKTLRGKRAEDIIFAGTNKKARLGMAEVSLYLNNEDNQMPVDDPQVVITRRLYRDGNGEYLLNKSKVRLFDIQELLAKSGFGQKTYSVIGQGMIDAILRAGPKERREMFEEAAGVKHFQLKKNISVNKLGRTRDNLDRAGDLLAEITPRRNSLRRQSRKAEKKDQVQQDLRELQQEYFNHSWNQSKKRQGEVREAIAKFSRQEKEIEQKIKEIEQAIDKAEQSIDYRQEDEQREKLDALNNQSNENKQQLAVVAGRIEVEEERDTQVDLRSLRQRQKIIQANVSSYREQIEALQREKESVASSLQEAEQKLAGISSQVVELEQQLRDKQTQTGKLDDENIKANLKNVFTKQNSFLEELKTCDDLEKLGSLRDRAASLQTELNQALQPLLEGDSQGAAEADELQKIQAQINSLLAEKEKLDGSISQYNIKVAVKETKSNTISEASAIQQKELTELEQKIEEATAGGDQKNTELTKLQADKAKRENGQKDLETEIKGLNEKLQQEREAKKEQRQQLFTFEQNYRNKQEELNKVRQDKSAGEIRQAKVDSEKELLLDEIRDNTSAEEYTDLLAEFENNSLVVEEARVQELQDKIRKLRQQLIKIGEIDPAVIEEYKECNERFEFLTSQRSDLDEAIKSLSKIIAELDGTIKQKFEVAFKNINQHFQKYFAVLFGGGKAKLVKTKVTMRQRAEEGEEGDEEQSDEESKTEPKMEEIIDIKATPPGKKLRELSMLSGGERALTSIALLFAIITNNPAPFLVLDEVDAALDESNTGRYADIVASLAKKSQFIVITHNRETMRRSDLLYGVTMEESGVSKLLSVKLDNLE
ncbi:MAG: AAA family ATPase [Parcubacteria group bacterium]|nr:AAA family ATPase [Parcubacteria group bacterium]